MVPLPSPRHYFRPLTVEQARLRDEVFKACIGVLSLEVDTRPRNPVPPMSHRLGRFVGCLGDPGETILYIAQVLAGLRFPYDPELVDLCRRLRLAPTQLTPSAIRTWVGFRALCSRFSWRCSSDVFRCFYRASTDPDTGMCSLFPRFPSFPDAKPDEIDSRMCAWDSCLPFLRDPSPIDDEWKFSYMYFNDGGMPWPLSFNVDDPPPLLTSLSYLERETLVLICRAHLSLQYSPVRVRRISQLHLTSAEMALTRSRVHC